MSFCLSFYNNSQCLKPCNASHVITKAMLMKTKNFSFLSQIKYPFPEQLIMDIVTNYEIFEKIWEFDGISQQIKDHLWCFKILKFVLPLPQSRIEVDNFDYNWNVAFNFRDEMSEINSKCCNMSFNGDKQMWAMFCEENFLLYPLYNSQINILPKCNRFLPIFECIFDQDWIAVFVVNNRDCNINNNNKEIKDFYNSFIDINSCNLVAFFQIQLSPLSHKLTNIEQYYLNYHKSKEYFVIKSSQWLSNEIRLKFNVQIHNKLWSIQENYNFNVMISKIFQTQFNLIIPFDNEFKWNDDPHKYYVKNDDNNIDPWYNCVLKNPGINSFVRCCKCLLPYKISKHPFIQSYHQRINFVCWNCSQNNNINIESICLNQIRLIYQYLPKIQQYLCIIIHPTINRYSSCLLKLSHFANSKRLLKMSQLVSSQPQQDDNILLFSRTKYIQFNEYKNIIKHYLYPLLLTYFDTYHNNHDFNEKHLLQYFICHKTFTKGQLVEWFDVNNDSWKLAKIIGSNSKQWVFRVLSYHNQNDNNNNNNASAIKTIYAHLVNNELNLRRILINHNNFELKLFQSQFKHINFEEFDNYLQHFIDNNVPNKFEEIEIYFMNGLFTGGIQWNNFLPDIVIWLLSHEIDSHHNSLHTKHPWVISHPKGHDISSNKSVNYRIKSFEEQSIEGYAGNHITISPSDIPQNFFRFVSMLNDIFGFLKGHNDERQHQLLTYFNNIGIGPHLDIYSIFNLLSDPTIDSLALNTRIFRWGLEGRSVIIQSQLSIVSQPGSYLMQSRWFLTLFKHGIGHKDLKHNELDLCLFGGFNKSIIRRCLKHCHKVKTKGLCYNSQLITKEELKNIPIDEQPSK